MRTPAWEPDALLVHEQLTLALVGTDLVEPEDFSFLAPDRPVYQCQGRSKTVTGPNGDTHVFRPCSRLLPDLCFRPLVYDRGTTVMRRPVRSWCVRCEQGANDAQKRLWRYDRKAANLIGSHRRKELRQGLHRCTTTAEYEALTGVTRPWLGAELQSVHERPGAVCPHCDIPWSEMPNGLADLSVDRVDRKRLLSRSNLVFMCRTGNTQKGTKDPRTFEVRQAYYRHIERSRI